MKAAPFEYHAPETIQRALDAVAAFGDTQKVLAGGQSLVPLLNMRLAQVDHIIDLNRIDQLRYIHIERDHVAIGAMTTQRAFERDAAMTEALPMVVQAVSHIAHFQIRNRGTIGGSIAHADPAAELPLMLLVQGGEIQARSSRATRTISAEDMFRGFFTTSLKSDEIVTEVRFHRLPPGAGWAFHEVSRRPGDFALLAVSAVIEMEDGHVARSRIGIAGGGDRPVRAIEAETAMAGRLANPSTFAEAAERVVSAINPTSDVHAPAEYRRAAAKALTLRALGEAHRRALMMGERGE